MQAAQPSFPSGAPRAGTTVTRSCSGVTGFSQGIVFQGSKPRTPETLRFVYSVSHTLGPHFWQVRVHTYLRTLQLTGLLHVFFHLTHTLLGNHIHTQ